jgi:oxygen tolerance protein BatD
MNTFTTTTLAAVVAAVTLIAGATQVAEAAATQRIEPTQIGMGDSARLTITASGNDASTISPPMVAGLEFLDVAQSQRIESINGVSSASTTVTYQVTPQEPGVFTIPGAAAGSSPVVLTVNPGSGPGAATRGGIASPAAPSARASTLPAGSTRVAANGTAFVRLRLSKHELYVGETIPIDIQVGMRDGFVASLNGLPTLNGDAFTLNKLSSQPQRAEEIIDGRPYTVLTWHSALAAVKPGELALTIETPLTVRMHTAARPDAGLLGEGDIDNLFNDPMFQNFFGTSTEKDITVASAPTAFTVLALPTHDRPADFSGAVGNFSISSDVSDEKVAAGDPVTLRLRISGTGNFDRVTTSMLHHVEHWKTYSPTAKFTAEDDVGHRGEKTFEQPLIATQPGTQSLPALTFSWFDPNSRRYVVARTSPLSVAITANTPASQGSTTASQLSASSKKSSASSAGYRDNHGLRPDHVETGSVTASLMPDYYQPAYLAAPSFLLAAFSGVWFWMRRREQIAVAQSAKANEFPQTECLLGSMEEARAAGDTTRFFQSARLALTGALASEWQVDPASITLANVEARIGASSVAARVFKLADEAAYAGTTLAPADFLWWTQLVLREVNNEAMS